jgi:nucleotide-binding universal stress UspA family protein
MRAIQMFKTILHADDGSEGAEKALILALGLAKQTGAKLHIVCVEEISEFPETIGEVKNEKRIADRRYRALLRRAEAQAEKEGVKVETHLLTGHPVRDIIMLAGELGADLLVIGATGHSTFYERLIGSRAGRLVDLAPCPVLVAK